MPVSRPLGLLGLGAQPATECDVRVEPRPGVAVADRLAHGEHLADLGHAVAHTAQDAADREVHPVVVEEPHHAHQY